MRIRVSLTAITCLLRSLQAKVSLTTEEVHKATHSLLLLSHMISWQLLRNSSTYTMLVVQAGTGLKTTVNRKVDTWPQSTVMLKPWSFRALLMLIMVESSISALTTRTRKVPSSGPIIVPLIMLPTIIGIQESQITEDGGKNTVFTQDTEVTWNGTTFHAGCTNHLSASSSVEMSMSDLACN